MDDLCQFVKKESKDFTELKDQIKSSENNDKRVYKKSSEIITIHEESENDVTSHSSK